MIKFHNGCIAVYCGARLVIYFCSILFNCRIIIQYLSVASNFPSSEESNAEDGTSGKLTGLAILSPQNVPFR